MYLYHESKIARNAEGQLGVYVKPLVSFTLSATGTGTGVAVFRINVSSDIVLTVDGSAHFYSNSGGTANESSTYTVVAGAMRTRYVKCTSLNSNFTFSDIEKVIEWGNSVSSDGWNAATNGPSIGGDLSKFSTTGMTYIKVATANTLYGNLTNHTALIGIHLGTGTTVSGDVTNMTNLKYIRVGINGALIGDVTARGAGMLRIQSTNASSHIQADITDMVNLNYLYMGDADGSITGSVNNLSLLTNIYTANLNTISGDIRNLNTATYIQIKGNNTITGDIGNTAFLSNKTAIILDPCNINTYTPGVTYPDMGLTISPRVGFGLDASEVDNIFIDMANSHTVSGQIIDLRGTNAAYTINASVAVAALEASGNTVYHNPIA